MKKRIEANGYKVLLVEVKQRIRSAQYRAQRAINKELIGLYWDIGKMIVERQKKHGWGKGIVKRLAQDLQREFDTKQGYSVQNLWYMRQFYLEYKDDPELQQLVGEIPWGHNIYVFSRIKDKKARGYYLKSAVRFGWSRNVLLNQIKANAYRLHLKEPKQHNFNQALPVHLAEQANESIKDVYSLDFLNITKPILERELEKRLVEKVKRFILELGVGFTFIGNQYCLTLGNNEYYIDLLFFNRSLKCLVAIELKTGKFEPEYAGKMDFYLNLLNDRVKLKEENPSIGIILCAKKDKIVVEYALRSIKNPVGIVQYHLTNKLPKKLKGIFPSGQEFKKQIEEELENWPQNATTSKY